MAAAPEPGWPKLAGFREHIGEFDGVKNYDTTGNHAHQCRWSTKFIIRVLAIIRTKLKGIALEIFDAEIGTINCYFKSNIAANQNVIDEMKDTLNYPTDLDYQYNRIYTTHHKCHNPKGFRETFNQAFLVDAIQQTAQKDFWSFDFIKGLGYNNDNGMRLLINKYKKLMQIANWQWGKNFYGGEYMFLLQRMPPAIMKHISSMNPKPANRNDFFSAADNQFLAVRLIMSLTGNLKEKKEITPLHVTSANNPVITKEIVRNLKDNKLQQSNNSQKEIITKETITKEETTRKEITTIIGKIVTIIIEEDITT
ncbi:18291_t:CDS:2 [Gigaspora margarita]|uniref:18291_t:CDS:1 n=1 Tax=Gigaspora margarita TaxID=4874 RepID=A0ABN7VNP0_GIGMA|nr:18291_t:CDS:2 [Gigaspora margarita]